jgi:type IV pilus assembly protein PilN
VSRSSAPAEDAKPRPRVSFPGRLGSVRSSLLPSSAFPAQPPDASPPLDLLRERRQQLDLEPFSSLMALRPVLLRRGLLLGGLILGASLGLCALLLVVQQTLRAREAELAVYEQEATQLRATMASEGANVNALRAANQQFVKRLSDVRSSSALLADLQLRVPEGVQLTKVQMLSPTEMRLEGLARDPVGFGRVNAMELVLRQSPLFQATGVTIEKVERVEGRELDVKPKANAKQGLQSLKVQLPSAVSFQMKATLSPLTPGERVNIMDRLKAEGLQRRLELLRREGLLK